MITVQLSPEVEARLTAQAEARGVAVGEYAAQLLESAVVATPAAQNPRRRREDIDEFFRAMAEGSENLPDLPTESFTRESFYEK